VVVWYYADVANTTSASTLDWTYTTSSSASTADWGYATWPTMTIQWVNPAETADQRRVREERVTAERARAVQERAERLVADRRAEQLLVRHLTPEQRRTLRRNRWFVIEGQSGRRYQIGTAQHAGNIRLLGDDGELPPTDGRGAALRFDPDAEAHAGGRRRDLPPYREHHAASSWAGRVSVLLYILEGHEPKVCPDPVAWARWFQEADRRVALHLVAGYEISTVFLGLDQAFGLSPRPILFETKVFALGQRSLGEVATRRYATWDQAELGHAALLAQYIP
jgi:hypothetical protein